MVNLRKKTYTSFLAFLIGYCGYNLTKDSYQIYRCIKPFTKQEVESKLEGRINKLSDGQKEEIYKKILDNAKDNKTLFFGEIHTSQTLFYNLPVEADSDILLHVLPDLKEKGFGYLALELPRNPKNDSREYLADYANGDKTYEDFTFKEECNAQISAGGWTNLIDQAKALGFKIINYDAVRKDIGEESEKEAFNNLKELVFDKDPNAKAIVFAGAAHANETFYEQGDKKIKTLSSYLEEYTQGKNYSVSCHKSAKDVDLYIPLIVE